MRILLNETDLKIIECLKENSRIQWKQIGEKVHMTGQAVANRIQRLEEEGIIEGYTVQVNEAKLGNLFCGYITVIMKNYNHTTFKEFIQQRDEVKEAHRVSGENCFILKVQLPSHEQLNELLDEILVYGYYKLNMSIGKCK